MQITRILVMIDNPDLRIKIIDNLRFCRYEVYGAANIQDMNYSLRCDHWNILLLDSSVSNSSAAEATTRLRKIYGFDLRIVIISLCDNVQDRINAIQAGADAYLITPIDFRELNAIVHQLTLRLDVKHNKNNNSPQWHLNHQELELICPNAKIISLTVTESLLLEMLLNQLGVHISRDALCTCLPPIVQQDDTRRLDSILSRLRTKIKMEAGLDLPIHAMRNKGYIFTGVYS